MTHGYWYWRWIEAAVGVVLACLTILAYWVYEAWIGVHATPKADMYCCDQHGLVPKDLCIVFEDPEDRESPPQYQCPFCYEKAFKVADASLKEKERVRL